MRNIFNFIKVNILDSKKGTLIVLIITLIILILAIIFNW